MMEPEELYHDFDRRTSPEAVGLREGDYVISIESGGGVRGRKTSWKTNAYILSQIDKLHPLDGRVKLRDPENNVNYYVHTGRTLGFISPNSCVLPIKVDDEKLSTNVEFNKGAQHEGREVFVRIGVNSGKACIVPATYLGYREDIKIHRVWVKNVKGQTAKIMVMGENIFSELPE